MANLNKVMLIGRLTRDPETRTFSNGGKVANMGFAVTGQRKKNPQTGQWEDEPCFLDLKAFNSLHENGRKLADLCEQSLRKGSQVYFEGHLVLEQWTNQEGQKQSKIKVIVEDLQFLEPKPQGGMGGSGGMSRPAAVSRPSVDSYPSSNGTSDGYEEQHAPMEPPAAHTGDNIPF
jgi:single-strand DNA-binding protein